FLIAVDGVPMIQHVVNMFGAEDNFHFVLNSQQIKEFPQIEKILRSVAIKVDLVIIEPHEFGPTHSAMQVKNISDDDELIISYCDFFVDWNYNNFKRQVYGYDGAIPSFRGFHPASFGNTYYAYMRVNENDEMLELREKKSFTEKRHEEFASAGIYYFKNWKIFKKYAEKIHQTGFENIKEGYVSLLFNPMVHDGLRIKITEIEHFICFGTPEDLVQYNFWSKYFSAANYNSVLPKNNRQQINLIPLAGKGSRFKEYGYKAGKPLITVRHRPMIIAASESFPAADQWIFLPRADDLKKHPIENTLRNKFPDCKIIPVDSDTSGQAATCLLATKEIDLQASLFIASCDYETRFDEKKWNEIIADESISAAIWTYRMGSNLIKNPKAFAYCDVKKNSNEIIKIVEKDTISDNPWQDPLVVGTFWFREAKDFIFSATEAIKNNITVNGEHYVANSMNILLQQGKKIVIFDIEQWISFGDPFELQIFYYWQDFFEKKKRGKL
ncbi:MAG TPA: hypothetical protein VI861_00840, partial [Rickettsiales bacterium]|nr:hypothetical protein [Rickettsiales bacterium]